MQKKNIWKNRNIILFLIARAFFIPMFWLPILYIYLIEFKQLSIIQTTFLLSIQEFALVFLEIPTGILADKISRRVSVAIGYVLSGLPFALLPFVGNYYLIITIFLFKAIGKGFISGADTSLLYDTLIDLNATSEYKKIIALSKSLFTGVMAICIIIGSLVYKSNPALPLILPVPLLIIGAIAVLMIKEPKVTLLSRFKQHKNYFKHILESLKYVFAGVPMILAIIIFTSSDALGVNLKWLYTPIFTQLNMNIVFIGGITAILYGLKAIINFISIKFIHKNPLVNVAISSLFTAIFFIIMSSFFKQTIAIVTMMGIILTSEVMDSSIEEYIHGKLDSKIRATAMSIVNMCGSIGATIMLNGFGLINISFGIQKSILFISTFFILSFILTVVLNRLNINKIID
jgi:MFS family permease